MIEGSMPTSDNAFAAVAVALGGVDPNDGQAVQDFWRVDFLGMSAAAREIIGDFLIASTTAPSTAELHRLRLHIEASDADSPPPEAMAGRLAGFMARRPA